MDAILIGSVWYLDKEIEYYLTRIFNFLKSFRVNTEGFITGNVVIPKMI